MFRKAKYVKTKASLRTKKATTGVAHVRKINMKICLPFFHDFSRWETTERGQVLSGHSVLLGPTPPDEYRHTGFYLRQERTCGRCGRAEVRTTKGKI